MQRRLLLLLSMLAIGCSQSMPPQPAKEISLQTGRAGSDASADRPTFLPENSPTEKDYPELHNLLQVSDRIYSGGEPKTAAAFGSLEQLGVRTIVSVDGAAPQVELAEQHGLRYVHIPIGYDGVSDEAGRALARVVRDVEGPIYVHCHHGKHRGPAAAAITCIADGAVGGDQALEILKRAGTGANYAGLWHDVAAYQPPPADAVLPELVSVAKVESLAAAMAKIDRASDNLKLLAANEWQPPSKHPDLVATAEAVLLLEGFREAVRLQATDYDKQFQSWMQDAATTAESFNVALGQSSPDAADLWPKLQSQCRRCHQGYRD